MFKLLASNKQSDSNMSVDLDNKCKAIIQDMSTDSEDSPSPIESSKPSECINATADSIDTNELNKESDTINNLSNNNNLDNKSDETPNVVDKKNSPIIKQLSDDSSSDESSSDDSDDSDESEDSDESDESIVLPKNEINNDEPNSESDTSESDESVEAEPVKPKKKNETKNINGLDKKHKLNGMNNKKTIEQSSMPKKKIRLSDAKNISLNKDDDRSKNKKDEVFCGGLPFSITEEQVRDLFEDDCGEILKISVLDGKGIAFIKFAREEYASKAVEYDGTEFMGRKLRINLSSEKGKPQIQRTRSNNSISDNPPSNEICVRNINYKTTEDTLRELFSECGHVTRCHIPVYEDTGKPLGRCFISFGSVEEASKALEYDNTEIDGRVVSISYAMPRAPRDRGASAFRGRKPFKSNTGNNFQSNSTQSNTIQIAKPGSKSIVFEDSD